MKVFFYIPALIVILFASCKTSSETNIKKIIATQRSIMPADSIIQKQKKGIDVIATGNIPAYWSLEIDFDKLVSFRSSDGTTLNVLPAFEKKDITAAVETYMLKTDLGQVDIKIFNTNCTEDKTGVQSDKKAEVNIQNRVYSGCGKYLFDHRLNDIWVLESINDLMLSGKDFSRGLPNMQFNLQENKMTGSDGCNNIFTNIELKGDRIKFSIFGGTKMACSNNKVEKIFNQMLSNKLVDYYMENNKLILYLDDDSKLNFKRKDL